jgi:hypothetical protein
MRRGHRALVIFAVRQEESVSNFMHGLFEQPLLQYRDVWGKPIKLLPQAVCGYQTAGSANLGFSKNKRQDRDVQVDCRDAQNSP